MKPEHRLEQILQGTLARTSAERETYLDEVCAGDQELRRAVYSALESHNDVLPRIS
jgi:hypothetical protein